MPSCNKNLQLFAARLSMYEFLLLTNIEGFEMY